MQRVLKEIFQKWKRDILPANGWSLQLMGIEHLELRNSLETWKSSEHSKEANSAEQHKDLKSWVS
jgi:hypothetical protein